MKSMLQEGSTIFKAIEKAWNNCGNPEEFTIKILEYGDKNFFGITKKPAVISINYQNANIPKTKDIKFEKRDSNKKDKSKKARGMIQDFDKNKTKPKNKEQDSHVTHKKTVTKEWSKELIQDVENWLNDITKIMGINVEFTVNTDQRILNVHLKKSVLQGSENEKMLFISLSHLLMQFLKKKHKKRFNNYYLIIHSDILEKNGAKKNKAS